MIVLNFVPFPFVGVLHSPSGLHISVNVAK